jgi:hypothetical protein
LKLEALAFVKMLPPRAVDIGPDVTRDELRAAGVGAWSAEVQFRDDARCVPAVLDAADRAPAERKALPELSDFDEVIPTAERDTKKGEVVTVLRFGSGG